MNRRWTNLIRFAMDDLLPPIIRDSRWLMWPLFALAYRRRDVRQLMELKREIWAYTPEQYRSLYAGLDSISRRRPTDLNLRCLEAIADTITPHDRSVLDVGCGNGYLLRFLQGRHPGCCYTGLDVVTPKEPMPDGISLLEGDISTLTLPSKSYDVVLCTHVLEHLLDYRAAMKRLVEAARRRVVFVVPRQRPYRYTLDEHVNFFLFPEQFAYEVGLRDFRVEVLDGDIFYSGKIEEESA